MSHRLHTFLQQVHHHTNALRKSLKEDAPEIRRVAREAMLFLDSVEDGRIEALVEKDIQEAKRTVQKLEGFLDATNTVLTEVQGELAPHQTAEDAEADARLALASATADKRAAEEKLAKVVGKKAPAKKAPARKS